MAIPRMLAATLLTLLVPACAQAADPLEPYFGNTFISLHDDGTQYIVHWNADRTFTLARRGGARPTDGYVMRGTYTLEGERACFHTDGPPPAAAPSCVPMEFGVRAGTVWELDKPVHELHMIVIGRSAALLSAEIAPEPLPSGR